MSGAEAGFVIGLIGSLISIIEGAKKVYDAAGDAKGQPEAFRQVSARLPLVIEILRNAKAAAPKLDETKQEAIEPVIKSCKAKAEKLQEIFQKVIRKYDDKWYDRYKKALGTLGKRNKVEYLMKGILKDIQVLVYKRLTGTANDVQMKEIEDTIKQMSEMPSSLPDEAGDAGDFYKTSLETFPSSRKRKFVLSATSTHNALSRHRHALRTLEGHSSLVYSVAFSPDGKQVVSGSSDKTVRLWDATTGAALQILEGHTGRVTSVAFSTDGTRLASASHDKTVRIWDATIGKWLQTLQDHTSWITSVAFSPDGKQVVSGSSDKTVRLWDAATGTVLQILEGHTGWVTSVAFSTDGTRLASASDDKTARIWDATTGVQLHTLHGHTDGVTSVAFSTDGTRLASASDDERVRLWDAATGAALQILEGHTGRVTSVAFSTDGTRLASASHDKTVRIWGATTGEQLHILNGHTDGVTSVAFSTDGTRLVSASWDKMVWLWDATTKFAEVDKTNRPTLEQRQGTHGDDHPKEMEDSAGFDDEENCDEGQRGWPKLIARGRKRPPEVDSYGNLSYASKKVFVIVNHATANALNGFRFRIEEILDKMSPNKWISVDFLRIGYSLIANQNPVVILITVEEDLISKEEAKRVVLELEAACLGAKLTDVEVEMREGRRLLCTSVQDGPEPLPDPENIPLVGSSIALAREHTQIKTGCGTLGGYVLVDGVKYGLTNHHVCFGFMRSEPYPNEAEIIPRYAIKQPAEDDLESTLASLRDQEMSMEDVQAPETVLNPLREKIRLFESWKSENRTIGYVYRSSGLRACDGEVGIRFRMDWALIRLEDLMTPSNGDPIFNKIPFYFILRQTSRPGYISSAASIVGESLTITTLPKYLNRSLTLSELRFKQDKVERGLVVWKFGRTTHHTFGIASEILSLYKSPDGIVSDELAVKDKDFSGNDVFSKGGDSGSFVWDSDGYVVGMLWGGKEQTFVTYVTPMETILDDIKKACKASDVRLVVRAEDARSAVPI